MKIWQGEVELWLEVQKTIVSVTTSLSETFALNTVVSDLMSLTNTIFAPAATKSFHRTIQFHALTSLLRLMAPITPAFSEECWEILHGGEGSVFEQEWPEQDGTLEKLKKNTRVCAVQVNGRLRFTFDLENPRKGLEGRELEEWVVERVLANEKGKGLRKWRKVFVVRRGRTVNFLV